MTFQQLCLRYGLCKQKCLMLANAAPALPDPFKAAKKLWLRAPFKADERP